GHGVESFRTVVPHSLRRALVRARHSEEHAQRGGLTGAVRAEEAVDAGGGDFEIEAVDDRAAAAAAAVHLPQPACADDDGHATGLMPYVTVDSTAVETTGERS